MDKKNKKINKIISKIKKKKIEYEERLSLLDEKLKKAGPIFYVSAFCRDCSASNPSILFTSKDKAREYIDLLWNKFGNDLKKRELKISVLENKWLSHEDDLTYIFIDTIPEDATQKFIELIKFNL